MEFTVNAEDGVAIAYQTVGSTGPPLLLVHGSLLSHTIWRTFGYVKALAADYRLILVDMRGHGRSDKPHDVRAYSMDRITGDLLAVLDATAAEAVHYLGYSFGGRAGLSLAAAAPGRIRSLIVGGASHRPMAGAFDALFFPGCADVLERSGMEGFLDTWDFYRAVPVDPATRAAFLANDSRALVAYFRATDTEAGLADSAVSAMTFPALFFVGSEDTDRLADTEAAAALLPGSELHVVPGFDHATMLSAAPQVLALAAPFLART